MGLAVIGGTGVYDPTWLESAQEREIETPYGPTRVTEGRLSGMADPVFFMNRHGAGHRVPPHRINYRANMWALRELGVRRVVATAAVGSLNVAMGPGAFVLVDQFLDFTKSRAGTFFEGGEMGVVHTDMTEPFCPSGRGALADAGREVGLTLISGGTYVTTEGPRFESAAEIRAFRLLGGDVVGMTMVPEVVLARELGLCYVGLALVTNYAAGMTRSALTHQEVLDVMAGNVSRLRHLLGVGLSKMAEEDGCGCQGPESPLTGTSPVSP